MTATRPVSTWDVDQRRKQLDIERTNAQLATVRTFAEQLDDAVAFYEGRRTVQAEAVRRVVEVARAALAESQTAADQYLAGVKATHTEETAWLRAHIEQERARADGYLELKRLKESHEQHGPNADATVTIRAGLGGWQLSHLEEIAYRLRCGGGEDETPIEVTKHVVTAHLPAPSLVPLDRPGAVPRVPERPSPLSDPVRPELGLRLQPAVFVGVVVALGALLGLLVEVIL